MVSTEERLDALEAAVASQRAEHQALLARHEQLKRISACMAKRLLALHGANDFFGIVIDSPELDAVIGVEDDCTKAMKTAAFDTA